MKKDPLIVRKAIAALLALTHMLWDNVAYAGNEPTGSNVKRSLPPFISPAGKPYRSQAEEPYAKAQWFAALDGDRNEELTVHDFVGEAEAFFKELDSDADGRIALSEITHYEQVVAPEVQAGSLPAGAGDMRPPPGMSIPSDMGGGPPDGGPPKGMGDGTRQSAGRGKETPSRISANMPRGAARFAILGMPQPIMAADANLNGSVTLDEMRAAAIQRFGWLDALGDGDGKLGWNELPKAPVEAQINRSPKAKKKMGETNDEGKVLPSQRQPIP